MSYRGSDKEKATRRLRYLKNIEQERARAREYYWKNREVQLGKRKKYFEENKEQIRKVQKIRYLRKQKEILQYKKDYYEQNIEMMRERNRQHYHKSKNAKALSYARGMKRRALKKGNLVPEWMPPVNNDIIKEMEKVKLQLIKIYGKATFHTDHIIPLSRGGFHHQDNLRVVSAKINNTKYMKMDEELEEIPYCHYRKRPYTFSLEGFQDKTE